jgi:tRNA(Leu) C34 or U34 (ribose-2'-O)-methylase TrmL
VSLERLKQVKDVTDNYSLADTDTKLYNTAVSTCAMVGKRQHTNNPHGFKVVDRSLANRTQTQRQELTDEAKQLNKLAVESYSTIQNKMQSTSVLLTDAILKATNSKASGKFITDSNHLVKPESALGKRPAG